MNLGNLLWIYLIFATLLPVMHRRWIDAQRLLRMRSLEKRRGTRVISLIHRQETMSFLGIPVARYINIEDSEAVLTAIRTTPPDLPIDIILHTPGGLVLASEQIAESLKRHPARVTVLVPHYAMSGGTLIALAAEEIILDPNAVLGPVDPQIGEYPAASILAAVEQPNPNRDDRTLILADLSRKALRQVRETVLALLKGRLPDDQAALTAEALTSGQWTHDYPIDVEKARALGLPVATEMPMEVYDLMALYPQPMQRRPSVEYIPVPYAPQPPPEPARRAPRHRS
ncbi:MAG TPA: ATP-dependent Clp protease proteolytic subunit [Armatimonadota bacterium]|jgi:ClpP class serine protease